MKRSKHIDFYIVALTVIGLAVAALRFFALLDFDPESMHFNDGMLIGIANVLTTLGVCIFATGLFLLPPDLDLVPSADNAATHIPTGIMAIALMFSAAERAAVLRDGIYASGSVLYYLTVALLVLSVLSVVAFFLLIFINKSQSVINAYFFIFIVLYLAAYSLYLYFNKSVHPTNSPNKIIDQLAYLFSAMFFLFETRIPLGRAYWRPYIAFGFAASLLTAYSALPALVLYFYNGYVISDSICESATTLALCIFITARVILTSVLHDDVQCPAAAAVSELANARIEEIAENKRLSLARDTDNNEEIESADVENYQFDIYSEQSAAENAEK